MEKAFSLLICVMLLALSVLPAFAADANFGEILGESVSIVSDSVADAVDEIYDAVDDAVDGAYDAVGEAMGYADVATATPLISGNVVDMADLLTDSQEQSLNSRISEIKEKYAYEIVIVTTDSIGDKTIVEYTDDLYDYNGYGIGKNRDGMLFCINMNNGAGEGGRDYYTSTSGFGITAFTDYAILNDSSVINAAVLEYLYEEDFDGAFNKYLDLADSFLAEAKEGKAYDVGHRYKDVKSILKGEAIAVFVALIAAFLITRIIKQRLNTAVQKTDAGDYAQGHAVVTMSRDFFRSTHTTRTRIERNSSSGGSSTHTSSSGSSHGGGGGHF